MPIDVAATNEVIRVFDSRWRRSYLATRSITLPVTAGYDEVCPYWRFDNARPGDSVSVKGANPRPPAASETLFTPQDIVGSPGTLGTGYAEVQLVGDVRRTIQAGGTIRTEEHSFDFLTWLFLPKARSSELATYYTSAIKSLWDRVHLLRATFAPYFSGNLGIYELRQARPIPDAVEEGTKESFSVFSIKIPLVMRLALSGDHSVTSP